MKTEAERISAKTRTEVKHSRERETQLRAAERNTSIKREREEGRGGGQWNPVDEVTYMTGVIRRLLLLRLCDL